MFFRKITVCVISGKSWDVVFQISSFFDILLDSRFIYFTYLTHSKTKQLLGHLTEMIHALNSSIQSIFSELVGLNPIQSTEQGCLGGSV